MQKLVLLIFSLLTAAGLSAQQTVTGTVTDAEAMPLIGATVMLVGTTTGTVTDVDGKFSIDAGPEDELRISYTGYEATTVTVGNQNTLEIILNSDVETLENVVVIGYGSVEKSDVTGSVSSLELESEESSQFNTVQSYLQGRVAGVRVTGTGSQPGDPNSIRIRGSNSLRGNNEPLYVVDGIIVNSSTEGTIDPLSGGNSYQSAQNGMTGINPQDIESIEILKDASATAIYGSRGANGVIIITTKSGQAGKAKVTYNGFVRAGRATNLVDFLSTEEYIDYQNNSRALQEFDPRFYTYDDGSVAEFQNSAEFLEANRDSIPRLEAVNWYDDVFRTSISTNHRLTVSGGSETENFYLAGGYLQNQGVVPNSSAESGDFLLKYQRDLNRFSISTRIGATSTVNRASKGTENLGGVNSSIIRQITLGAPLLGYSENNLVDDFENQIDGPRAWLTDYDDDSRDVRGLMSLQVDYDISDVFTYRLQFGGDYRYKNRQKWYGTALRRGQISNGEAGTSRLDRFRYNIDNTLMFNHRFDGGHKLDGTVGVIWDVTDLEASGFSSSDFANGDLRYSGISYGQVFTPLIYNTYQEKLLSFLGRVNYGYKNRYLLTLTFRSDGTSKFADGNKFSYFPAAAFAWRAINEPFLEDQNLLSDLKLRLGYGLTGSQAIDAYQTLARYGPTANLLSDAEGNGVTAFIPLNLANPNLIWETTAQTNVGVDFGLWNNRLSGTVDVYRKRTYNLLQEFKLGPSTGFQTFIANQGDLLNRGVEFSLSATVARTEKLRVSVNGNIAFNRNEIQSLGLPETQFGDGTYSAFVGDNVSGGNFFKAPANIFIEGRPAGLFYGYETDGIVNDAGRLSSAPDVQGRETQLGDVYFVDQDGDGNITEQDLTIIGDPNPKFNYGFGADVNYGAFSLNLLFTGVHGNDIANGNLARSAFAIGGTNNIRTEAYLDAWSPDNPDGAYPRVNYTPPGDFLDRFVEDGSFLRLSFASLSYALPSGTVGFLDAASIYVSGQNLLLFTDYSGFDPEVDSFSFDPGRRGLDWGSFPNQRSVTVGLNVTL